MDKNFDCIVIGAGPAGIMAAGMSAGRGQKTAILERNEVIGRKLQLTGGGRCNIGNLVGIRDFLNAFGRSGQFLRQALSTFGPDELKTFLADLGISLIEEDTNLFVAGGGRKLVEGLAEFLNRRGVKVFYHQQVTAIHILSDGKFDAVTKTGSFTSSGKVIITTGGRSYPATGSTGDGFTLARQLGHEITPLVPAMGPIHLSENIFTGLAGISLPRVTIEVFIDDKREGKFTGGFLITHHGISGPAILDASLSIARGLQKNKSVYLKINFVPAGALNELDTLEKFPHRLKEMFLIHVGVDTAKKPIQISRPQRQQLFQMLKSMKLTVANTGSWDQGMVTVGGVALNQVNPRTLESLLVKGIHFAGEVLDLAASCGGYNIQAALSTGYLAGIS
ncbi:MAG: aminoacetone oxidase family FAD-binding enzyme [Phycisphaerae bacterium]